MGECNQYCRTYIHVVGYTQGAYIEEGGDAPPARRETAAATLQTCNCLLETSGRSVDTEENIEMKLLYFFPFWLGSFYIDDAEKYVTANVFLY